MLYDLVQVQSVNMPKFIEAREICDSRLEKPFRLIIGGGSGSGKTSFLKQLVDLNHFSSPFDKIVYFYPEYLPEADLQARRSRSKLQIVSPNSFRGGSNGSSGG